MAVLSERQARVFREPNEAVVATLNPDGSPHTSVVWVDWDGEYVSFNTTLERAKTRHLRRDPRISITVIDPSGPYRHVTVEGTAELDEAGAAEHMNRMARKYTGEDWGDVSGRVVVRVRPERVHGHGIDG
jgi:PPOX class probable F420-dependent enzyme